ncbi:hypothetical protein C6N75_24725 [Streptomyces solincola]|uniref:Uncharacterized protein n=1 Tax=Streptomyces solincola TaxID=2100817 RepID=A0A2S9PQC9_9ACTN|nr:hypothetical protein [Streptomyces solincola]PRH76603.1 hypothetical protein C6N75_24725 [Streptomyces solincola]
MSYDSADRDRAAAPRTQPSPRHLGARPGDEQQPAPPAAMAKGPAAPGVTPEAAPFGAPRPPARPGAPAAGQGPTAPPAAPGAGPSAGHTPPAGAADPTLTGHLAPTAPEAGPSGHTVPGADHAAGADPRQPGATAGHPSPVPAVTPVTAPDAAPAAGPSHHSGHSGHSGHGEHGGYGEHGGRGGHGGGAELLPRQERDELTRRMQHALSEFVDSPQRAVQEAAGVLESATEHLTAALDERRRSLRTNWDGDGDGRTGKERAAERAQDTEKLRVTLREYREMTERLLKL